MFLAASEAWDRKKLSETTDVRTISIPTGNVRTLNFELTEAERTELYGSGLESAREFFTGREGYMNSFGRRAQGPAVALSAR
jgi:hypothetical protein